ncbi:AarF/ABC1/UbiB kinase family protein [candidate division WOR-3 bacterium]|uniref:AarF/ABC1/UbiB kinase family protein n=1 Tax=candidate division WOR-3 bacterium TaxID=2052148 RepID=A0A937XE70_UNCW3|nr:AarF/ABC1/UbiB kinase family protein [candidate division WOR-3 bacterium]
MSQTPEGPCRRPDQPSLPEFDPFGWLKGRRQFTRARHIGAVLVRHGLAELAMRLGLEGRLRFGRKARPDAAALSEPERLVKALEELGPTFIKLGQMLSTRPDLVPPDFVKALAKLQDNVPGIPYDEVERVVATETCRLPDDIFAEFDREPLAAASLSQVHRARLATGEEVAVKVQRPGIARMIDGDLAILASVARFIERHQPDLVMYDPVGLVAEFDRSLRLELDFVHEGQNADICRRNFVDDPSVIVPKIHWNCTTSRLLVLDLFTGVKATDAAGLGQAGIDRHKLGQSGGRVYMKMIFEHGFFQPDPHPGNLVVMSDGRLGVIDYGMFSRIDDETRDLLVDMLLAAYRQDSNRLLRLVLKVGSKGAHVDEAGLHTDIRDLLDRYYGANLRELSFGRVLRELLAVIRRHRITVPAGLAMVVRGLATVEGLGLLIDPEFNFIEEMKPFLERLAWRRFGPLGWFKDLRRYEADFESLVRDLPADLRQISDWLKKGEIKLQIDHEELRQIVRNLSGSNNQLAAAIVLAAIIVGASLLVVAAPTALRSLVPVIGIAAFVAAAAIGVYLLLAVLRRR